MGTAGSKTDDMEYATAPTRKKGTGGAQCTKFYYDNFAGPGECPNGYYEGNTGSSGLSAGAIAGIVILCIIVVAVVAAALYLKFSRSSTYEDDMDTQMDEGTFLAEGTSPDVQEL